MNIVQLASKEGRGFKEVLVHVDRRTITLTQVTVFVCLSVVYRPLLENIPLIWRRHHGDDGRNNCRPRLGAFEQGGSLWCHTCYGKGPWVCGLIPKDCLNVVASYEKQGKQKNQTFVSLLSFLLFLPCFLHFFLFFFFVIQTWCNTTLSPGSVALNYTRTFFISVLTARRRYQVI